MQNENQKLHFLTKILKKNSDMIERNLEYVNYMQSMFELSLQNLLNILIKTSILRQTD